MFYDQHKTKIIHNRLEQSLGKRLLLKINDNRSTLLSVKWEPSFTKVSLHHMFLQAPRNVMKALTCYLRGGDNRLDPSIKAFIETGIQSLDYSHQLDSSKLQVSGKVYNLQKLYREINDTYFNRPLGLRITWFGHGKRISRRRVTFGLYHDALRLIKINRLLDDVQFPEYFVSYVIYHEMLHYVYPAYVDETGRKQIHSPEFKRQEKKFEYYREAEHWIREHQSLLFKGRRFHYGRS